MSIQAYRIALHIKGMATGETKVAVHPITNESQAGRHCVGILIDSGNKPHYTYDSTWTHRPKEAIEAARTALDRVIDKLEPAIQCLFQRYLGEHIEELRVAAVASAEALRDSEIKTAEERLAEMNRPWNAPEVTDAT